MSHAAASAIGAGLWVGTLCWLGFFAFMWGLRVPPALRTRKERRA